MRMQIVLPLHLWERLRRQAQEDMRSLKDEAVWLIALALDAVQRQHEEDARRPCPLKATAAGEKQEHQPHKAGGEADA